MVSTASSNPPSSSRPLSRTSGSALQRPQSATDSRRPQSSLGLNRPASSLSARRPLSRQSQRPHPQQSRSRLLPLCQTLVSQVSGAKNDDPKYSNLCENAFKSLESIFRTKVVATVDMTTVERQIRGLVFNKADGAA
jgi:gamma-tubulin complex component 5